MGHNFSLNKKYSLNKWPNCHKPKSEWAKPLRCIVPHLVFLKFFVFHITELILLNHTFSFPRISLLMLSLLINLSTHNSLLCRFIYFLSLSTCLSIDSFICHDLLTYLTLIYWVDTQRLFYFLSIFLSTDIQVRKLLTH